MRYRAAKPLPLLFGALIGCLLCACSNSEGVDGDSALGWNSEDSAYDIRTAENPLTNSADSQDSVPPIIEYLPLDDSEYPYAGIPRIVIETENHREIKDRETEIPAKLQIWGEHAPESKIMDLTIRGRGNTSWGYPKKPYAIKFEKKQAFLGMPKAKKWVMLANYRDRTLIRNALAFEIARKTCQKWVPQGKFADVFLNDKFIGNYYICEKIQANRNRLNLTDEDFLLEFDIAYDEEFKFKTAYKNLPVNIKHPSNPSKEQKNYIHQYIDEIEHHLYGHCDTANIIQNINMQSLASFWIIQEVTQNTESNHPKSLYAYKDTILNIGPVWDFDWNTFTSSKKGLRIKEKTLWFDTLSNNITFIDIVKQEWNADKKSFYTLINYIDSLANYIEQSNEINHSIWPINIDKGLTGDENKAFTSAIQMLKDVYVKRLNELDLLFNSLQ